MEHRLIIGVIGAGQATPEGCAIARQVGQLLAERGAVVVCGGLGGVMEAAAQGCAEAGGTVLGILPGPEPSEANPFVTLPVPTNMGYARNVIIVHAARALIAVEGEYGTLSEMAVALKLGRPVIALNSRWQMAGVTAAATPLEAVQLALALAADGLNPEGRCPST